MDVKVIEVNNVLEGDAKQVADQIFGGYIVPAFNEIAKDAPFSAMQFVTIIAGNGISLCLSGTRTDKLDSAAKILHDLVDEVLTNVKASRIKKS